MKKFASISICLISILISITVSSQEVPKKPITLADYAKWGKLTDNCISQNGDWVSYGMQYNEAPDTLFIAGVSGKKRYSIPSTTMGTFMRNHRFVCLDNTRTLHFLNLHSGKMKQVHGVQSYLLSSDHHYLVTLEELLERKTLKIRDIDGTLVHEMEGVVEFQLNNKQNTLLVSRINEQCNSIIVLPLSDSFKSNTITEQKDIRYSNLVWSDSDRSLAFLAENEKEENKKIIYHYSLDQQKLSKLNPETCEEFPKEFDLSTRHNSITISADDRRLVFGMIRAYTKEDVQIWNTNDVVIYAEKKQLGELEQSFQMAVWMPETGKMSQITSEKHPYCILNTTKKYALYYGYNDTPPPYTMNRNVNYYVKNLETGEEDLLITDQSTGLHISSMSPKGKYFAYFHKGDWWVYNFNKKTKQKISLPDHIDFGREEYANENTAYGVAGWGFEDSHLLLYDQYDIWKVSLQENSSYRLTKGREKKKVYRVIDHNKIKYFLGAGNNDLLIDLEKELMLSIDADHQSGYAIYKPTGKIQEISFGHLQYSRMAKSTGSSKFIFQAQDHALPSQIRYGETGSNKLKVLYQSNSHYLHYQEARQEMLTYVNSKGDTLQGILNYPTDYHPNQQYPMVVFIYEEQNQQRHKYNNPSRYNMTGFNLSALTAEGYFVLLPDIKYELGNPGKSALDCVLAATNSAIEFASIRKERIALMGQSFGGYETNFIVTQTPIFKTAISGVSIYDLERMYLSLSASSGTPEVWRFESQQWRMGTSFFENRKIYTENSPSSYVENVSTPMLLWAGEVDTQIDPNQSIAFYIALRRLKKEAVLLLYDNESHSLMNSKNQVDLHDKLKDWLAFHLKDEPRAMWIGKDWK